MRKQRNLLVTILVLGVGLATATGCAPQTTKLPPSNSVPSRIVTANSPQTNTAAADNPQPQWAPVAGVVLAQSPVPGVTRQVLELVDVHGQYANNPIVGPFQGPNWIGQFQLRLLDDHGTVVSALSLPAEQFTLFMQKFNFQFSDYNGDGFPDFTLGQRMGSNGYVYSVFTIEPSGLKELSVPASQIFSATFDYSTRFPKVQANSFRVESYDNSQGKWLWTTYAWRGSRFTKVSQTAQTSP